jgi:hypothetical protein
MRWASALLGGQPSFDGTRPVDEVAPELVVPETAITRLASSNCLGFGEHQIGRLVLI